MTKQTTLETYVYLESDGGTCECSGGLTKSEAISFLPESAETYDIEFVVRLNMENGVWEVEDCSDEIFEAVAAEATENYSAEPDDVVQTYKGKLGELIDDYIQSHPQTKYEQYIDRKIDEARGK